MSVFDLSVLTASAVFAVPVWEAGIAAALIAVLCGLITFRTKFGRATVAFVALTFVLTASQALFLCSIDRRRPSGPSNAGRSPLASPD